MGEIVRSSVLAELGCERFSSNLKQAWFPRHHLPWRQNKPNKESSGNIRCQAVKIAVWLTDDQPASEGIAHNCGD